MSWSWGSSTNNNNNNNNNNTSSSNNNSTSFSWGNSSNNNNNNNASSNNNSNASSWGFGNNNSNNSNNNNNNNNSNTANTSSFSWGAGSEGNTNNNNNNTNNGSFAWGNSNNSNNNNNNTNTNTNTNSNNSFSWKGNSNSNTNSNNNSASINPNNDSIVNDITPDSISCIEYHPSKDIFCVGSWDNTITLYEQFGNQSRKLSQQKHDKPVLATCWNTNDGNSLYSAGCDNKINVWMPQQNNFMSIGQHQSPIRCIKYCKEINAVISGSWDCNMSFWDVRNPQSTRSVFNKNFGSKIYAMAQRGKWLVVALSNQDIQVFDLRNYQQKHSSTKDEESNFNSSSGGNKPVTLKRQIRSLSIFPDCGGYAGSSIGGRVIIKHLDSYNKKKDFSFKCHRQKANNNNKRNQIEYVFGVNVLKFHEPTGVFLTGGDDGDMVIWDKDNRAKLFSFKSMKIPNYNSNNNDSTIKSDVMPIVAADYNHNGQYLCYATSYNWNKGQEFANKNQQKPTVYLHQVNPKEVEKSKK